MTAQPIAELQVPQSEDPIPNLAELILNGNGVSLTYLVNEAIKTFIQQDPLGTVTNKVAGNWEELQRASQAVGNLSAYNTAVSTAVSTATATVRGTWEGNASDNAAQYFGTIVEALDLQVQPLASISDELDTFATAAYELAGLAAGAVQSLVDNTVIALTVLAASVAAKAGVVSAPASLGLDAVLAVQILRIVTYFYKLTGLIGDIFTSAEGIIGTITAMSAGLQFENLKELPESGYKHPGVNA